MNVFGAWFSLSDETKLRPIEPAEEEEGEDEEGEDEEEGEMEYDSNGDELPRKKICKC